MQMLRVPIETIDSESVALLTPENEACSDREEFVRELHGRVEEGSEMQKREEVWPWYERA